MCVCLLWVPYLLSTDAGSLSGLLRLERRRSRMLPGGARLPLRFPAGADV